MRLELDRRRYLVLGGSRGLGRAVAEELLSHGARVLIASREPEAAARELGEGASAVAADLGAPDGPERIASAVASFGERLDGVLVNSGGPPTGRALELDDGSWRAAFELLLMGPIRLLRELAPRMAGGGSVVWITSSSVRQPIENLDTSNVLRPGVAALVNVLARELGPGIRVNSLAPGRFDTDRVHELDADRASALGASLGEVRERHTRSIPLRRYGEPRELARVATFLLSDAASYVNGAAVQVDGGSVTAVP